MNSISKHVKEDGLEIQNLRQNLEEYIYSEETTEYDPVREFLEALPEWDGHDHVAVLFGRIPGITAEQLSFMQVWLRSMVAHWMGMDTLHGNECVVTLIGRQGCGKSTWCARLLPPHLRTYYLDHLNLGNKFDKEMALTNNLLVNLDGMIDYCYRAPEEGEVVRPTLTHDIVRQLSEEFPSVEVNMSNSVKVGRILKERQFQSKVMKQGNAYYVVRKTA